MTMFGMLTAYSSAVALSLLALPASGHILEFDMISNGSYWWGSSWTHMPEHGGTDSCICVKGQKMNGKLDVVCFPGLKCPGDHPCHYQKEIPFDGNFPIDITTHGHDALWLDRIKVETNAGSRWIGSDDTKGWCLSKDENDTFDKYASHNGCAETLSIRTDGHLTQYRGGIAGYGMGHWTGVGGINLVLNSIVQCNRFSRRRAEDPSMAEVTSMAGTADDSSEGRLYPDNSIEYSDPDPTGESPNQVHGEVDALVVSSLHDAIRTLVRENDDVTDGQIDKLLNSAMLEVEHIVEQEEDEEGEMLEPEGTDGLEPQDLALLEETGSSNDDSNVEGSNVLGRLQDLEEENP